MAAKNLSRNREKPHRSLVAGVELIKRAYPIPKKF
jgi:hypothetical protein